MSETKSLEFTLRASSDVAKLISSKMNPNLAVQYHRLATKLLHNEGKLKTIKVLKGYYLIATKVAQRQPFVPQAFRKSDSEGYPKDISIFKEFLKSRDYRKRRAALTILRSYASLYAPLDLNTDSITTKGTDVKLEPWYTMWINFLARWCKKFNFSYPEWSIRNVHGSTKRGPNGPALLWAHTDLLALSNDENLWNAFKGYNLVMNQEALTKYAEDLIKLIKDELPQNYIHSKLSFLREGGGKTRVIAIGDYWTKEALVAFHKATLGYLKQLRTDGTYDQNHIAGITRKMTSSRKPVFCFDLSNATDRFPVLLQEDLVRNIIGKEAAMTWKTLLTERTFTTPKGGVRYATGQPMGLFTSWPVFALTHHAVIEFCASLCGFRHFEDYVVLGDDVAIFNQDVSREYEKLLNSMEVPISKEKSTFSYGPPHHAGEIAKRLFIDGEEVSPVPPDIILKARRDITLFPMLIRVMLDRGIKITPPEAGTLMESWFGKTKYHHYGPLLSVPSGLPGHIKWPGEPVPYEKCQLEINSNRNTPLSKWNLYDFTEVQKVLLGKRISSLTQKTMRMQSLHRKLTTNKGKEIQSSTRVASYRWLQSQGVPIPNSVLHDLVDVYNDMNFFLPLIHVTQKELMNLMILLDRLDDADPDIIGSLDPKEYVPDITLGKYFTTNQEQREKRTSVLVLDVLAELEKLAQR